MKASELELIARKYGVSPGVRKRNQANQVEYSPSCPQPEQVICNDPLGPQRRKEENPSRCKVIVVSYRKRLIDPDNLCVKYFVDALRYCGVIKDDTAKHIVIEVAQEKVTQDQRTEITVIPLEVQPSNK